MRRRRTTSIRSDCEQPQHDKWTTTPAAMFDGPVDVMRDRAMPT